MNYRVDITDREDPVTQGLEDFDILSEQYYMHVDPNVKALFLLPIWYASSEN